MPLTEGVADTNMLTPMRDFVDHSFQDCILQAEGVEYLEETGVPDSIKSFREINKTVCDAKTYMTLYIFFLFC